MAKLINGLSVSAVKAALFVVPQNIKDELAVCCLAHYKEDIEDYINKMATDKQFEIEVGDVTVEIV